MKVQGKVVLVTGAAAGIGRELTRELVRRGAQVAAVDINAKGLAETAALLPGPSRPLETYALNIADRSEVEALPAKIIERFGAIDGVINCAGIIQPFVRLKDLDYAAIERVFDVNWRGTLYLTKTFLPYLLERPEAHIVNVSSMGGFLPVPGQAVYGASKAAVKLFTEGLHSELAGTGVRVTLVFPGAIGTDIATNSGVSVGHAQQKPEDLEKQRRRTLPADKAARDILDATEEDRFRVLVGKDAKLLDALYRLHPERAAAFIAKQMKSLLERTAAT